MAKEVDIDAIRRRIQALKQEADLQQEIFNNDKRRTTSLKKVQEIMEEIFRLQEEIDKELLKSDQLYKDITKSIAAAAKQERLLAIGGKDFFGMGQSVLTSLQEQLQTHKDIKAAQDVSEDLSTKINNIAGDIISKGYDLQGIEVSRLDIAKEIQKLDAEKDADLIDNLKGLDKVLVKEKNRLLVNKGIEKSMSAADGVLGGMAGKIKGFITNPLTIAVALLVAFNEQQETIAKEFGAIGVTEFRDELSRANREFVQLGLAGADSQKTISDLTNNFGIAFSEARKLAGENITLQGNFDPSWLFAPITEIERLAKEMVDGFGKDRYIANLGHGILPTVPVENAKAFINAIKNYSA